MADAVEKKYLYKIFRNNSFLGVLQNVKSQFSISQQINTAGTQLIIEVSETIDRQFEPTEPILTEDGEPITDEFGEPLLTERKPDIVGNSSEDILIRNNNDIEVYEISTDYPNGKLVFAGWISKWKAIISDNDSIQITCLSNGSELDNYLILGAATLDQSQSSQTQRGAFVGGSDGNFGGAGQTITIGASVSNISSIILKLAIDQDETEPQTAYLKIWPSVAHANSGTGLLGETSRQITNAEVSPGTDEYTFTFATPVSVTPGGSVFITITTAANQTIFFGYADISAYAGGRQYSKTSGGPFTEESSTFDLYFKTYFTAGATNSPYSSQDPTLILRSIIDNYVARGGVVNYNGTSTDLTGTSVAYTFSVNTILEGIKKVLDISPSDWYWYVDPGTSILYFKQTATTEQHTLIYGQHLEELEVEATVEDVKNTVYFTGGDTGSGENLFVSETDEEGLADNNNRVGLARLTDNRVTLSDTADAIIENFLDANRNEAYITSVVINNDTYDTNTFALGQTVGFNGFGSFVDDLMLQIVSISRKPDSVTLGLGTLFRRASTKVEEIERRLNAVETVDNPTAPS